MKVPLVVMMVSFMAFILLSSISFFLNYNSFSFYILSLSSLDCPCCEYLPRTPCLRQTSRGMLFLRFIK